MEAYGVVYRAQPSVAGAGIDDRRSRLAVAVGGRTNGAGSLRIPRPRGRTAAVVRRCGFSDEGSLKYYYNNSPPRCRGGGGGVVEEEVKKKAMKKRLKLLKGLVSMDHLDNNNNTQQGLLDQIKANLISDATKVLLTQLGQQLRAEEKELKRKKKEAKAIRKQEKKKKKMMLQCDEESSSSSSSSSSSESDCGEVVDMSRLKNQVLTPPPPPPPAVVNELQPEEQQNSPVASQSQLSAGHGLVEELDSRVNVAIVEEQPLLLSSSSVENKKKIEVCMGGKCKKSGAALLIEEFNKVLGGASSTVAVGCKCMGKCKSAPNVRVVLNDTSTTQTPPATTKSLCIGVGLDDVSTIVSNFLLQNHNTVDDGFVAAAAM